MGINILLCFVMGFMLFSVILVIGYKEDLGQDTTSIDPDGYEYYASGERNITCAQVEEFYQAVSNTVGGIDYLVVQRENTDKVITFSAVEQASITSFYPFDMSLLSDTLTEAFFEDDHHLMISYDEYDRLLYSFSSAEANGSIVVTQPSPNEISVSLTSDEGFTELFMTSALPLDKISPNQRPLFLITSWEKMNSASSPITGVSFIAPEALTDEEVSEVNRLSKYLLGSEFVLYNESQENPNAIPAFFVYLGVGLAEFALLQIFLYICSLRKQEYLVFEFCGETSWGILFHCMYHFVVLLILADVIGVSLSLIFNSVSRRYDLLIMLRTISIATNVIVFDLMALMICSVRVFIGEVRRKELRP